MLEDYKENINTFTKQINEKKTILQQLEKTKTVNENFTHDEQKTLEKRLFNLKQKLENEREKLKNIDKLLLTKTAKSIEINNTASKVSAFDDSSFDRNSNLMSKSFNENMFYNRNKIEVSHFDFNLNLDSEDSKEDAKVLNAVVAAPETRNSNANNSSRLNQVIDTDNSDNASPLMMPKYHSLSSINLPQDEAVPSSNSHKSNGGAPATGVVQRQIPKHKRPLTRYLPNFSLNFNLKQHIETAGHQLQLCPHVLIDGNSRDMLITSTTLTQHLFSQNSHELPRLFKQSRCQAIVLKFARQHSMVRVWSWTSNAGLLLW